MHVHGSDSGWQVELSASYVQVLVQLFEPSAGRLVGEYLYRCAHQNISTAADTPKTLMRVFVALPRCTTGEAVNNSLFDGVYFDCCCGKAPGVPRAEAAKFAADAQSAFDRALAFIAGANKWASAWNSDGTISQGTCTRVMEKWLKKGADPSVSLQPLATVFRKPNHLGSAPPPPPPVTCANSCTVTKGQDTQNSGIVAHPVRMPDQTDATAPANLAECCSRCKANTKCEVFELGHGGCAGGANCSSTTINCFLIGGFTGQTRGNKDRAYGCVRGATAPPPPTPNPSQREAAQNNTVAAFMIARGPSAMLEV